MVGCFPGHQTVLQRCNLASYSSCLSFSLSFFSFLPSLFLSFSSLALSLSISSFLLYFWCRALRVSLENQVQKKTRYMPESWGPGRHRRGRPVCLLSAIYLLRWVTPGAAEGGSVHPGTLWSEPLILVEQMSSQSLGTTSRYLRHIILVTLYNPTLIGLSRSLCLSLREFKSLG